MDIVSFSDNESRIAHNASILTRVLMIVSLPAAGLFAYAGYIHNAPQLFIPAAFLVARVIFDFLPLWLIKRGRTGLAMMLVMASFIINGLIVSFIVQGLGLIIALAIGLVVLSIAILALHPKYTIAGLLFGVTFSLLALTLDNLLGPGRVQIPELQRFLPYVPAVMIVLYAYLLAREFNRFNLQTKITLGIIVTGGFAVGVISFFAANQAGQITNLLASRLETNVKQLAEERLVNTVKLEAGYTDEFFSYIGNKVNYLAAYRVSLQNRKDVLELGGYWNAGQSLVRLEGGQYGNSAQEPSSIFVPAFVPLDEAALLELNTSAYLDFSVPQELKLNPSILAIYAIDNRGIVRYYPNIELASVLPADFNATERSYYEITSPLFNPERKTRWAIPYVDAAGGGLVVTVASPVYYDDSFNGIVAGDLQLSIITEQLSSIKVGETGYAFMVDDAGRLIYMPSAGYELFAIDPNELVTDEFYKYSILSKGSRELQAFTNRMVAGGSGLGVIQANGIETYISFAPVPSTGYSLALVVPTAEMQTAIPATQQETENQLRAAVQIGLVILAATFLGALLVSIALGQLIASPLRNLTQTANRIAGGDLTARAKIASSDESGILARSFNAMASQLTETLQGLETRITERTSELEALSKTNAYRATRFESIARISRIISTTRNLEQLLPQITETISAELGYYHVGIFLVDVHRDYAILVAANSEGGKAMLEHGHRLRVGETGLVGYATQSGMARIALDVGHDAIFFNNPDLPQTHSEVALPLRSGSEIIGALDVQSKLPNAFSEEDVNILSVLADQVSIAIQNARSFQQSLEALEKAENAAAQLSEQQWSEFRKSQSGSGFHFDGVQAQEVTSKKQIKQSNNYAIPIMVRGVQIGTLKLSTSDPNRKWDNNEIAMAQATAERTALAIETARLLEDAQKRASKERAIGQISAKIGSLVNIDNIVQTTIQELGNTLPGTDVAIQFTSRPSEQH